MTTFRVQRPAARAIVLLPILACLLTSCSSDDPSAPEKARLASVESHAWVAIEPTQCLTNPWERDWLDRHNDDYGAYPREYPTRLTPEELEIIKEYYARQGVVVFDAITRPKYEEVCLACNCPEGHTLYLSVREKDVETMIGMGYREEMPLK